MMKKARIPLLVATAILCIGLAVPNITVAYASSVQDGDSLVPDDSIYQDPDGEDEEMDPDAFETKDTSILSKILAMPLVLFGDFLKYLTESAGLSMDNVVYGRLNGGGTVLAINGTPVRVNLFGFELAKGNVYGLVGSAVYAVLRGVIYVIMVCVLFAKVVAATYSGNGSKALNALKEGIGNSILAFLLLGLMPYILDIAVYVRDVVLNYIGTGVPQVLGFGGASTSISDVFYDLRNSGIINSCMYIASIALNVYFAFTYVMVAMSVVVNYISFPFICVNMQFDKNALNTYFKNMRGYLMVPILDSCLLLIPAFIGSLSNGSFALSCIQLLVCYGILPARSALRSAMGLSSNMGMEMAGIGALLMAGRFASGVVGNTAGRISGAMGARKQRKANGDMANMEDELSQIEADGEPGAYRLGGHIDNPEKVAGIYDSHATADNFDSPEFANKISHAKRAELLRERNKKEFGAHGGKTAAKTIGGVMGAVYGAGAGIALGGMLNPAASMAFGALGTEAGGYLGDHAGSLAHRAATALQWQTGQGEGEAPHAVPDPVLPTVGDRGELQGEAVDGLPLAVAPPGGMPSPDRVHSFEEQQNQSFRGFVSRGDNLSALSDMVRTGRGSFADARNRGEFQKIYKECLSRTLDDYVPSDQYREAPEAEQKEMLSECQRREFFHKSSMIMGKYVRNDFKNAYQGGRLQGSGNEDTDNRYMDIMANRAAKVYFDDLFNGAGKEAMDATGWTFNPEDML